MYPFPIPAGPIGGAGLDPCSVLVRRHSSGRVCSTDEPESVLLSAYSERNDLDSHEVSGVAESTPPTASQGDRPDAGLYGTVAERTAHTANLRTSFSRVLEGMAAENRVEGHLGLELTVARLRLASGAVGH